MFCFERCLKFVSGYAYIFVFMQNTGFCTACFRTWRMMSSFPLQLSINRIVQRVLFAMQCACCPRRAPRSPCCACAPPLLAVRTGNMRQRLCMRVAGP